MLQQVMMVLWLVAHVLYNRDPPVGRRSVWVRKSYSLSLGEEELLT